MISRSDIARYGLMTRSEVKKLIADAMKGNSVDLTNINLCNATWYLSGNSRIVFSPDREDYNSGIYFDDAPMFKMIRGWSGDKQASIAQGLSFLEFANEVADANIAHHAGNLCFAAGAQNVKFGNGAQNATFGEYANSVVIGSEYGSNLYYGV